MKRMASNKELEKVNQVMNPNEILEMREIVDQIFSSEEIEAHIIRLVDATRFPNKYGLEHLKRYISMAFRLVQVYHFSKHQEFMQ